LDKKRNTSWKRVGILCSSDKGGKGEERWRESIGRFGLEQYPHAGGDPSSKKLVREERKREGAHRDRFPMKRTAIFEERWISGGGEVH